MNSIVLVGKLDDQEKIINDYLKKYSVANYNITRFPEKIIISDIRNIKRLVSRSSDGKRIIVFHENITLEAQNALLKTLEELPDDTFIFFFVSAVDRLIPTIISRSRIVRLLSENITDVSFPQEKLLSRFLSENDREIKLALGLLLSEEVSVGNKIDELIASLRKTLHVNIEDNNLIKAEKGMILLEHILENYNLVVLNNLNKRLFLDTAIIESIRV